MDHTATECERIVTLAGPTTAERAEMFNAVSKATAENTELAELFQTNLGLVQDSQKVGHLPPPARTTSDPVQ